MTLAQSAPTHLNPRLIYLADAGVSLLMGLALLFGAEPITTLAGWPLPPGFLAALGLFLLPWAVFNLWMGRSARVSRSVILANISVDAVWVIGSVVLLVMFANAMSTVGLVLLIVQALAVLCVLAVKATGMDALMR